MSGDNPIRDHFDKLAIDNGQLVIRGLPAGDYQLKQGDETTDILVSSGAETDGLLVSDTRILPRHAPPNPTIAKAGRRKTTNSSSNSATTGPATRVSLVGKRYRHFDWNCGIRALSVRPAGCRFTDARLHRLRISNRAAAQR